MKTFPKIWFFIKLLLKGCYVNSFSRLKLAPTTWIGKNVSIFFEKPGSELQRIQLGNHVRIGHFSELTVGTDHVIIVKDHTTFNTNCKVIGDVTIERYCLLSANILISSGEHYATRFPPLLIRQQDQRVLSHPLGRKAHSKPVHIEEDVWIGFGVYIRHGVTIGRGAVIGANAVVLNDIPPYEIHAGNPARKIKARLNFEPRKNLNPNREEDRPYFYRGFDHFNVGKNDSGSEKGILCDETCSVAIPALDSGTIICKGFFSGGGRFSLQVSIQAVFVGNFEIQEPLFELRIVIPKVEKTQSGDHSYAFLNFAAKSRKGRIGLTSIDII